MLSKVSLLLKILIILAVFLVLLIYLISNYFKHLKSVYKVAIDGLDSSFNSTFSKAWFLHFYLDEESERIYLENLK